MANQPVEVEIRGPGQSSAKPRSGTNAEQIYSVGDQSSGNSRGNSWLQRNAFLLCFLLGWILFPFWWGAAICGIKKRKSLKGVEKAAWYGCVALSIAGLIIFLIFIIWYGADPVGAKKRLTNYKDDEASAADADKLLTTYSITLKGACSEATYTELVASVSAAVLALTTADNSLLITKGKACQSGTTTGRHLLEQTSIYEVLIKVKAGTASDVELALTVLLNGLDNNSTPWCGTFCTNHAADILGHEAKPDGYKKCSVAAADGTAYVCQSGTLIGDNVAPNGEPSNAACCTACTSAVCPAPATVRSNITLPKGQAPTFELCCNPCAAITCASGAVSPAPALASVADANADICCVQEPVVAPAVTMSLPAPDCNTTSVAALADQTKRSLTDGANITQAEADTIHVKAQCNAASGSARRLNSVDFVILLTITIDPEKAKTKDEMHEATKVLCKVLDINTDDVNTTTPMSDFVQKLGQLNSTDKLTGLAGKLGDVCQAIGLNITIDIEILQKGFKATSAPCNCPGVPSSGDVVFLPSCSRTSVHGKCPGACSRGVGKFESVCGVDGKWEAPTGKCDNKATKKNCTGSPAAVLNATWPETCTGKAKCKATCVAGYSGEPTAVCDTESGEWMAPCGDCSPARCPPRTDDEGVDWPTSCLVNNVHDDICKAKCKPDAHGHAPSANCTVTGNSAEWKPTEDKCYMPTTCGGFNHSGVICAPKPSTFREMRDTSYVLHAEKFCYNPAAAGTDDADKCTPDACCYQPKVCADWMGLTINANLTCDNSSRVFAEKVCGETGEPECSLQVCCTPKTVCNTTAAYAQDFICTSHQKLRADLECGDGAEGDCTIETCCKPLIEYPVNATCGDVVGNATNFTFEACEHGREYDNSTYNKTITGMIDAEARLVCCRGIPDLKLTQYTTPAVVYFGDYFDLSVAVKNDGYQNATNVTVTQMLPMGMVYNGTAPAGCNITLNTMTCGPIANLPAQSDEVAYKVEVHYSSFGEHIPVLATAAGKGAVDGKDYAAEDQAEIDVLRTCAHFTEVGAKYNCTAEGDYVYRASADNATVYDEMVLGSCCNPTCAAWDDCSFGWANKANMSTIVCSNGECSNEVCCNPSCGASDICSAHKLSNNGSVALDICDVVAGCTQAKCCIAEVPKNCSTYNCTADYLAWKPDANHKVCDGADNNDCTQEFCCVAEVEKSCTVYNCTAHHLGWIEDANSYKCDGAGNPDCNVDTCCEPEVATNCTSYNCTAVNMELIATANTTACDGKDNPDCDYTLCCKPETEKVCTSFNCTTAGQFWVPKAGANTTVCDGYDNPNCDKDTCCYNDD